MAPAKALYRAVGLAGWKARRFCKWVSRSSYARAKASAKALDGLVGVCDLRLQIYRYIDMIKFKK